MLCDSTAISIRRPVDDVFAVLSDVEKTALWHPATVAEHWTTEGVPGVGSRRRAVSRSLGIRTENEAVVTVYEPNRALGLKSIESPIPFEIRIEFERVPDGTRVDWLIQMEPGGFYRSFGSLVMRAFVRQLDTGLARLKAMMESGEL